MLVKAVASTWFAAFGGWLMLGETLSARGIAGCALILGGMILSQLNISFAGMTAAVRRVLRA